MISVIWPYWDRQKVADESYALFCKHYANLEVEIVVVDDGNLEPYRPPKGPVPIRTVRLPFKRNPKNPCVPMNRGVEAAQGEIIVLTNPEVFHHNPVLLEMVCELTDELTYVQAAVIHNEGPRPQWHSHSSIAGKVEEGIKLPDGACFHHLSMLRWELWNAAGGFDEAYRDGYCFDDTDFVMRLGAAGAKFVMRDDLVVEHIRRGASPNWDKSTWDRNRNLFVEKWRDYAC